MKKVLNIFSKKEIKKEDLKIVVDNRERNSLVVSELVGLGFEIEWGQLAVGDYIVNGVVVERKTVPDFKASIINKRIVNQLLELKQFDKHFLIVEGIIEDDVYSSNGLHENAFRGFLLSVALEFRTPVIYTYDEKDTAKYLYVLARKKEKGDVGLRASKIFMTKEEQLQFILEGFPNVGATKAKKLLERFSSLKDIFNSSEEELAEVLGKRGKEFRDLLD